MSQNYRRIYLLVRQMSSNCGSVKAVVGFFVVVYAAYLLLPMIDAAQRDFHDFRIYYQAAQAFVQGGEPYEETFRAGNFDLYYLYTPITLILFAPFTWLSYNTACLVYLALKLFALLILMAIWSRRFLGSPGIWFLLFCLLSFNSTLYIDFEVGNTEVFQQLLIWSGLACFVAGRYRYFSFLILMAALFKITPILLLSLLLIRPGLKLSLRVLIVPLGIISGLVAVSLIFEPGWWPRFLIEVGRNTAMAAPFNQSFVNLVRSFLQLFDGADAGNLWPFALFLVHAMVVVVVTACIARGRLRRDVSGADQTMLVLFVVLAYLLVLPRLQDYQFALAIVPCFFVIQHARLPAAPLLFVLVVVQAVNIRLPGLLEFYKLFFQFKLLVVTYAAWVYLALSLSARGRDWLRL